MSYRITYSDDAKLDAKEIVAYLVEFNASAARNFKTKLVERVNSLAVSYLVGTFRRKE